MSPKSILDRTPVRTGAPALRAFTPAPDTSDTLELVSACPRCGAPVYAKRTVDAGEATVAVRYGCDCLALDRAAGRFEAARRTT